MEEKISKLIARFFFAGVILSCLTIIEVLASSFPNEDVVKPLVLSSKEFDRAKKIIRPNALAAMKVLSENGLQATLDSASPNTGGFGSVYLGPDAVVKVSYPRSSSSNQFESARLLLLKKAKGSNPVLGLHLAWPGVIYAPQVVGRKGRVQYLNHLQVAPRVFPANKMRSLALDVLILNVASSQVDIFAMGATIGRMQAASLRCLGKDRYVSDAHMDLHAGNIFPTGLLSMGQQSEITFIDLGDFKLGTEPDAPEVPVDVVYHLLKTYNNIQKAPAFAALSTTQQITYVHDYTLNFFIGYLSAFDGETRKGLRPIYTSMKALEKYEAGRIYIIRAPVKVKQQMWQTLIPAIAFAFDFHASPCPILKQLSPRILGSFNAKLYDELYPDACKDYALFQMEKEDFAKFHFVTWGLSSGFFFPQNNVVVPDGFNEDAYLEMYPDVTQEAAKFKIQGLKAFARIHYSNWGSKLAWGQESSRLILTVPMDLPVDFDSAVYLAKWPHLTDEATRFNIPIMTYTKVQYILFGKNIGQAYK